jgi:hypothetical protein
MTSQNDQQSENSRLEHFDDPELGSGARDSGSDTPEEGKADRPVGNVDADANPPMSDPTASDTYGGTGELPPQDTGSAVPPYEGRQQSAKGDGEGTTGAGGRRRIPMPSRPARRRPRAVRRSLRRTSNPLRKCRKPTATTTVSARRTSGVRVAASRRPERGDPAARPGGILRTLAAMGEPSART